MLKRLIRTPCGQEPSVIARRARLLSNQVGREAVVERKCRNPKEPPNRLESTGLFAQPRRATNRDLPKSNNAKRLIEFIARTQLSICGESRIWGIPQTVPPCAKFPMLLGAGVRHNNSLATNGLSRPCYPLRQVSS